MTVKLIITGKIKKLQVLTIRIQGGSRPKNRRGPFSKKKPSKLKELSDKPIWVRFFWLHLDQKWWKNPSKLKEFPQNRRGSESSLDPFVITYDYKSILPSNVILFENRKGVTTQIEFFWMMCENIHRTVERMLQHSVRWSKWKMLAPQKRKILHLKRQ